GTSNVDANPTALHSFPTRRSSDLNAPAMFPSGATTVTFIARDGAGNTATATTIVTVVDTTPPTFSGVPPPTTVEQTGPSGTSIVERKSTRRNTSRVQITYAIIGPA